MARFYTTMQLSIALLLSAMLGLSAAQNTNLIAAANLAPGQRLPNLAIQAEDSSRKIIMFGQIVPVTRQTGDGLSNVGLENSDANITGSLELVKLTGSGVVLGSGLKPRATAQAASTIRFLSCDTFSGNTNLTARFLEATSDDPLVLLLYSTVSEACTFAGADQNQYYQNVFTMISATTAKLFETNLNADPNPMEANIYYNGTATGTGEEGPTPTSSSAANSTSSVLGPAPSTAVAMIILYSITGLITFLFIVVITGGAIRAHRHPERYGPRPGGAAGRTRQSRAKGIARAVLDGIPIVRFNAAGDGEAPKTAPDIEMNRSTMDSVESSPQLGTSVEENTEEITHAPTGSNRSSTQAAPPDISEEPLPTIDEATKSKATMNPTQVECPICMDNFVAGQDLRVLPCHHSFHPECVDPWLLNVSGSCPLCRIDLHPEAPGSADATSASAADPASTPAADNTAAQPSAQPTRFARYRDVLRLTSVSSEERVRALRQLREESVARQHNRRSSRLSIGEDGRLRRMFIGRRRTLDATAAAPVIHPEGVESTEEQPSS